MRPISATQVNAARRRQHISARHYLGRHGPASAIDHSVRLAARHFDFPSAQVNIVDQAFQHTIAAHGTELGVIPRELSMCAGVVDSGAPVVVPDITPGGLADPYRVYVGVPLRGREGLPVGALCLLDTVPREFGSDQLRELHDVAAVVEEQLELRRREQGEHTRAVAESRELAAATEAGQIVPWYQPIIRLGDGRLTAVEALARWEHPDDGVLPPSEFLPRAERSDLVIDLDLAVLGRAMTDFGRWLTIRPDLRINVNLSARHFEYADCIDRITETVVDAGVDPGAVSLEVTESTAMAASPNDRAFLSELRSRGFRIVLDDFGTGFSSVGHVLRLPIDGIKLDRAVAASLGTTVGDAVGRALMTLARDLDFHTCIEGVESRRQAVLARRLGCDDGQGYHWSPALPASSIPNLLQEDAAG
ncbi:sensor domain-containing phosphodiesterase [Nakamurella alba]|uniref:sensor domain-containing phosphodiesterase n=1 Tax=Nakamurella alba TaxID=2665158 RepID=UPI0018AA64C9|nr:EAL domain-containing protein [Nakamurella alba]